jgi:molybdopterin/thiamine biosynthesis adenylyltransferase
MLHRAGEVADLQGPAPGLIGNYSPDGVSFTYNGTPCTVEYYDLVQDVFSRNTGILETSTLLDKSAVISGCGSVGSYVALELARSGVGKFLLIDNDRLSYHNVCRHQCGISEVGRLKVNVVADRIRDINPSAVVESIPSIIERVELNVWEKWMGPDSIIVGCADNREADLYANRLSQLFLTPFLSIGLWERAFAGELFWSLPSKTPCYHCVFGSRDTSLSFRSSQSRRVYTEEEDLAKAVFEPGISVDIGFVTNIGIKIALDLLCSTSAPRLITALQQFTLICNTTNVSVAGDLQELFDHPLQVTRSIEVTPLENCPHCALARKGQRSSHDGAATSAAQQ